MKIRSARFFALQVLTKGTHFIYFTFELSDTPDKKLPSRVVDFEKVKSKAIDFSFSFSFS